MSGQKGEARIAELRHGLAELESQFKTEARRRGFDPAQIENMALPAALAKLFAECEEIKSELEGIAIEDQRKVLPMTSEVKRIQDQFERAFAGGAWHGPSVWELLADVNAGKAAARPIAGAHSIWELVLHIAAWDKAVVRRLAGDRAELADEENWPAVGDQSDEAWQQALETLQRGHRELHEGIGRLEDAGLDQPIIEGLGSTYFTLHGAIQHDLYHAGQIAILKKT